MIKVVMETSENELKNVFVMKLNAHSLNIYNITLHPGKFIASKRL